MSVFTGINNKALKSQTDRSRIILKVKAGLVFKTSTGVIDVLPLIDPELSNAGVTLDPTLILYDKYRFIQLVQACCLKKDARNIFFF